MTERDRATRALRDLSCAGRSYKGETHPQYTEDDAGYIKWNPGCEPGFAPLPDPCVDLNYAVVEKKGGGVKEEVGDVSKKALSDRAINDINDTLHVFIRTKTILSIFCCK